MIGLALIDEFIACSDVEMEPHYICNLCGVRGEANGMHLHVSQKKHRASFFQEKFKDDPRFVDLPR